MPEVTTFTTGQGVCIHRFAVPVFPTLMGMVHVVVSDRHTVLIDTGSGLGDSNEHLAAGLAAAGIGWADLTRVVVTHGHVDHYGGLGFVCEHTDAPIAVHSLDRRVLTNHEERLVLSSRDVGVFLRAAGVAAEQRETILLMYGWSKGMFRSVDVSTVLHDGDTLDGLLRVIHTPGHCPGQVCLQVDDVLLTADQILPRTTPHLSPERITPSTGLEHYFASLERVAATAGIRLALGGHEAPMDDVYGRVEEIRASHRRKLGRVLAACAEPHTIAEIARLLHPQVQNYDTLLSLTSVGAMVEYLDQHGQLAIANLDEVANDERAVPRYVCE